MKKWIVAVIALMILANAGFGVFLRPLLYTLTPLQRYYLGPYLLSSVKSGEPAATTEVRWLWKVRPETGTVSRHAGQRGPSFRYDFATEDDVVPVPARELLWRSDRVPFGMSRKAELDGWSAVVWRNPVEMKSGQLAAGLRQNFYEGEPVWRFFLQPFLVLALGALLLWIVRRERAGYYRQHGWSGVPFWCHLGRESMEGLRQFRNKFKSPQAKPTMPASASVRGVAAAPVKPRVIQAETPTKSIPPLTVTPLAFSKPLAQPALWDESKGLE